MRAIHPDKAHGVAKIETGPLAGVHCHTVDFQGIRTCWLDTVPFDTTFQGTTEKLDHDIATLFEESLPFFESREEARTYFLERVEQMSHYDSTQK